MAQFIAKSDVGDTDAEKRVNGMADLGFEMREQLKGFDATATAKQIGDAIDTALRTYAGNGAAAEPGLYYEDGDDALQQVKADGNKLVLKADTSKKVNIQYQFDDKGNAKKMKIAGGTAPELIADGYADALLEEFAYAVTLGDAVKRNYVLATVNLRRCK